MAQAPHPAPKPAAPAPKPTLRDPAEGKPPAVVGDHATRSEHETPRQTIGVKGEPIEDGERDPDTVAEEQRRRAAEIEAVGVERWKYDHDTRSVEEKGVFADPHSEVEGQRQVEHHESRK